MIIIIIGAGSAGCAMAARLSEMPDARVLIIEAGPRDTNPFIHMPVGFAKMTSGNLLWGYETAPLKHANNRTAVYPQARVLGGGSSINAEIYTRVAARRIMIIGPMTWAARAGDWKSLKPYFVKSEGNTRLSGPDHGTDGRWPCLISIRHSPLV